MIAEAATKASPVSSRRVFVYTDGLPQRTGSGAEIRFYSSVRAYLDLGFAVELIQFCNTIDGRVPPAELEGLRWQRVRYQGPKASVAEVLQYRAGYPGKGACRYYFKHFDAIEAQVLAQARAYPGALHHFEGAAGAVIPFIPGVPSIYSSHDLGLLLVDYSSRLNAELENRAQSRAEKREIAFMRRFEPKMIQSAGLVLCISAFDCEVMSKNWNCSQAEFLPMSIADESPVRDRIWARDGMLRLLHLGRVGHLSSYRSLEFLLKDVFPRLGTDLRQRIRLNVVGTLTETNPRDKRILELARPYPEVCFCGFEANLDNTYAENDLQLVASSEATGLRTRIVEAFARGVPVLATPAAARGLVGIEDGTNILLASDAAQFQSILESLSYPERLQQIARQARETYDRLYSRAVVAETLRSHLKRYLDVDAPNSMD